MTIYTRIFPSSEDLMEDKQYQEYEQCPRETKEQTFPYVGLSLHSSHPPRRLIDPHICLLIMVVHVPHQLSLQDQFLVGIPHIASCLITDQDRVFNPLILLLQCLEVINLSES